MTKNLKAQKSPLYQQVKDHISRRIERGILKSGMRIESEAELCKLLKASRMTVNRALRELTAEGKLWRVQGRGTFVAEQKAQAALFEINSIAGEIKDRGGVYSCEVHLLQEEKAKPSLAQAMGLQPYATVYHSLIVHKDNGVPIQLGSRYINPLIAPEYLEQDFTKVNVSEYLLQHAPVNKIEHIVEALIPDPWIRELLDIGSFEPCLVLHRKTWTEALTATFSTFYYPGSRYTLGGKFLPDNSGKIGVI
jgi:GntR family histidine utilization transcriptional repressor